VVRALPFWNGMRLIHGSLARRRCTSRARDAQLLVTHRRASPDGCPGTALDIEEEGSSQWGLGRKALTRPSRRKAYRANRFDCRTPQGARPTRRASHQAERSSAYFSKQSIHKAWPVSPIGTAAQVQPCLISSLQACSGPTATTGPLSLKHLPHLASNVPFERRRRDVGARPVMTSRRFGSRIGSIQCNVSY
jgi:hypothetical protein